MQNNKLRNKKENSDEIAIYLQIKNSKFKSSLRENI